MKVLIVVFFDGQKWQKEYDWQPPFILPRNINFQAPGSVVLTVTDLHMDYDDFEGVCGYTIFGSVSRSLYNEENMRQNGFVPVQELAETS